MTAPLQHRAGEIIQDRYDVLGVLGSGAFGTVYQCRDRELDTLVAIKELHVLDAPNTHGDERTKALQQFRREALHLSHLRHPHIVSGHYQPHNGTWLICPVCGFSFKGTPACPQHNAKPIVLKQRNYLVMEYLDGPNLSEAALRAGGVLPIATAVRYIRQTCEALKLIHARGWVHRDIKPENIRVRGVGDEAVLLDFGIATESGAAGEFSTRAQRHTQGGGTLGYAPDSPHERRHPDARSDIHALGMTLYRLVSGRDPLEVDDLSAMRRFAPRAFNENVPAALDDLILRAIDPDPNCRPEDATAFLKELDTPVGSASTAVVSTPPAPPVVAPPPPVPQNILRFPSGESASTLPELVALCDRYPREAQELLFAGKFENWLQEIGRDILMRRCRDIRARYAKHARGLEAFLQATDLVEPPQLTTNVKQLDFGVVPVGQIRTLNLQLRNPGRGHLFGELRPSHESISAPREFDGNEVSIPITFAAGREKSGIYNGDLTLDSSAGELRIPVRAQVENQADGALSSVVFWAALGMMSGFLIRTLPFAGASTPGWEWLAWSNDLKLWPTAALFSIALLMALTPFVAGESLRRKSCATALSLSLFACLLSLFCGIFALDVLIGGDQMLRPFLRDLAKNWAAGAWMFVGAIFGASYGTLRRWNDVFSPRLLQILGGWLTAMAILYGLLAASQFIVPHR